MDTNVVGEAKMQVTYDKLYDKLQRCVWVVKIEGNAKGKPCRTYLTAFAVRKDGLLMTCAHGGWHTWSLRTVKVRRLDGVVGFEFDAEVMFIKTRWDMCLLKVSECSFKEANCVEFGAGNVKVGDKVLLIGHPKDFVGSFLMGYSAYACTENSRVLYDDFGTCFKYDCDALDSTPLYRVMGHVWNSGYFNEAHRLEIAEGRTKCDRSYEKHLQPRLPIIQCYGFIAGVGTSGGPIFNVDGELIGMLIVEADGYQIGIHVTALQIFLRENLPSEGDSNPREIDEVPSEGDSELTKSMSMCKKKKN